MLHSKVNIFLLSSAPCLPTIRIISQIDCMDCIRGPTIPYLDFPINKTI